MGEHKEIFKLKKMLEKWNIPFYFTENSTRFRKNYYFNVYIGKGMSVHEYDDLLVIDGGLTEEELENDEVLCNITAEEAFARIKYCYEEDIKNYIIKEQETLLKYFYGKVLLASFGLCLDILISDKDWRVRGAVARYGYRLDKLINDENYDVRCFASGKLRRLKNKRRKYKIC